MNQGAIETNCLSQAKNKVRTIHKSPYLVGFILDKELTCESMWPTVDLFAVHHTEEEATAVSGRV